MHKGIFIFLLSAIHIFSWSQTGNKIHVTGNFKDTQMTSVLNYLEKNYPLKFYFKEEWFTNNDRVNATFQNTPLSEALTEIFGKTSYTFKILYFNQVVILPRNDLAMLQGQIPDYSRNGQSQDKFILIGDIALAGRFKTAAVTGKVIDGKTGIPVIGATIQRENIQQGVITNNSGDYKLNLPVGLHTLVISSVGYEKTIYNVKVLSPGELTIEIFEKSVTLGDVVIYGQRLDNNLAGNQMSMIEMDINEINQLPSVTGGKDILKGLTSLPGVKSVGEFSSGINVRGGGEDQNLYLLNGSPLFSTSHVFGLYSVINPDMVEKLVFYKGHIPANYGERISSVIEIKTRESLPDKFNVKGGIGIYDSRLMAEIPLIKDKLFINLGGRTSYSSWMLKKMKDADLHGSKASFYDLNGDIHAVFGKHRISLSAYNSFDEFRFGSEQRYQYGNEAASFNWNYLKGANLGLYLSLAYSEYEVKKDNMGTLVMNDFFKSGINYSSAKFRVKYGGIQNHTLDVGFGFVRYNIRPGIRGPYDNNSLVESDTLEKEQGIEGSIFINDEISLNDHLIVNLGLRYSAYASLGPGSVNIYSGRPFDIEEISGTEYYDKNEKIRTYDGLEPRISMRYRLNASNSVKVSYNRNLQYVSLISYTSVSMPDDIWKLSDGFIKPMISNQFAMGFYRNLANNTIEASLEVYYKHIKNAVDYKDGPQLQMNRNLETELVNATGHNYGTELLIKKITGKFDGWLGYTYSRSLRQTHGNTSEESINNNKIYPSSYDRPHDVNIVANYHLNKRIQFSASFTYATGRPITLPEYKYYVGNEAIVYFSDKNKYRIPDYHRLDLSVSVNPSLKMNKKWKGQWTLSVMNVYARENAYAILYKKDEVMTSNTLRLYKLFLFGKPLPALSYSFIF